MQLLIAAKHTHCEEDECTDLQKYEEELIDVHPVVDALLDNVHMLINTGRDDYLFDHFQLLVNVGIVV